MNDYGFYSLLAVGWAAVIALIVMDKGRKR